MSVKMIDMNYEKVKKPNLAGLTNKIFLKCKKKGAPTIVYVLQKSAFKDHYCPSKYKFFIYLIRISCLQLFTKHFKFVEG